MLKIRIYEKYSTFSFFCVDVYNIIFRYRKEIFFAKKKVIEVYFFTVLREKYYLLQIYLDCDLAIKI